MESLEGNLVSTTNTHSNNTQCNRLKNHSSVSEHRNFKNEGENSQYNQLEGSVSRGSLFFHQQIFFPHAKMYNVDDNGRDVIQPSLFNTSHDMVNMEELSVCNKMSQPFCKSISPNNCKSIYDGVRGYSGNKTGYKVEGDSNLMQHQGPESSNKDSKSNKCRNIFYQMSGLSLYKSTHTGEKTYNCSEYSKISNHSTELVQQQTIRIHRKKTSVRYVGKSL